MRTIASALIASALLWPAVASSQTATSMATLPASHAGPYKILKTANVGGDGGYDYIYADVIGRRLYIPRGGQGAISACSISIH